MRKFFMIIVALLTITQTAIAKEKFIGNEYVIYQTTSMTKTNARNIFLGYTKTLNGIKVKLFFLPFNSDTTRRFSSKVLGLTPEQLEDKLGSLYSSGEIAKPVVLSDEKEMFIKIAKLKNAIGYLSDKWLISVASDGRIKLIYIED